MPPRCLQDASKTLPRRLQDVQDASKMPPRRLQDTPKTPQGAPKMPQGRPQDALRRLQDAFTRAKRPPRVPQDGPGEPQGDPKTTPRRPKMRFRGLPWPKIDVRMRFGGESTRQGRGGDKSTPLVQGIGWDLLFEESRTPLYTLGGTRPRRIRIL